MKQYKGWEIIKLLGEGKIENGTVFETDCEELGDVEIADGDFWSLKENECVTDYYSIYEISNIVFKEKGNGEKVDIQSIEPLNLKDFETLNEEAISSKVNELITAVKWLDEEVDRLCSSEVNVSEDD